MYKSSILVEDFSSSDIISHATAGSNALAPSVSTFSSSSALLRKSTSFLGPSPSVDVLLFLRVLLDANPLISYTSFCVYFP